MSVVKVGMRVRCRGLVRGLGSPVVGAVEGVVGHVAEVRVAILHVA